MNYPSLEQIYHDLKRYCNPKFIKREYPEFYEYLLKKFQFNGKLTEKMWLYYHNIINRPTCPVCGNEVNFRNLTEGYNKYCCQKCMSIATRNKARKTMYEKYGGTGFASEKTREKIISTNMELYGGIGFASDEIKSKIKNTMISRYGVDNPMKDEELRSKIYTTMISKYGVKHALESKVFLEKSKSTLFKHYGVYFPRQDKNIKDKQIATCIQNYGGVGMGSPLIKNKIIETNLNKYGRKYGFDYEKIKSTNLKRYGDANPLTAKCSRGEIKYKGYSNKSQKLFIEMDNLLSNIYYTQFALKGGEKSFKINKQTYYVDYFIEELNIAIEFNGDRWHGNPNLFVESDKCFPMDKNITAKNLWDLDKKKIDALQSIGVNVLVIWENEYDNGLNIKKWLKKNNIWTENN